MPDDPLPSPVTADRPGAFPCVARSQVVEGQQRSSGGALGGGCGAGGGDEDGGAKEGGEGEGGSEKVKLISTEGAEFVLERNVAFQCDLVKSMCEGGRFKEGKFQQIKFSNINTRVLEKVVDYLHYKYSHSYNAGSATDE
eukprot:GHVQ01004565.1.p1 GENE.GHVQ01004565.1~~GHVQ01004565.1.p1  ORF type:complete len:140 (+),score=29.92 GHVQ01004565.1:262-681(+)